LSKARRRRAGRSAPASSVPQDNGTVSADGTTVWPEPEWLLVESIDLEAQGVAHNEAGKVVFIEGALIHERVQANVHRKKGQWEQGVVTRITQESSSRVRPQCPHFGLHAGACGGCKMQHLDATAQVAVKQRALEDVLQHLGNVKPEVMLRPIEGMAWGYRDRARLSVRHVLKKGTVLVGFHERKSSYVADMRTCSVLAPHVSQMLVPLRDLVMSMDARDRLPQIELAVGGATTALVMRNLEPLSAPDADRLRAFAQLHHVQWWLQPKGPDTVALLDPLPDDSAAPLSYSLPEFGVTIDFKPTDFTQVNHRVNAVLVSRALKLLAVQPHEHVIDWFCGLGNFTLPLATQAKQVIGIEGSDTLVARAQHNAARNGLSGRTQFEATNLFEVSPGTLRAWPQAQAWLVDPPREGAMALVKALTALRQQQAALSDLASPGDLNDQDAWQAPERIVYVSCNPATLARDAGLLVHQAGYRMAAAGVVNMFAHTAHVEGIALFVRGEVPPPAASDAASDDDALVEPDEATA
jgi:23S rRNA (uracil1939-C5)-methyltransferase